MTRIDEAVGKLMRASKVHLLLREIPLADV